MLCCALGPNTTYVNFAFYSFQVDKIKYQSSIEFDVIDQPASYKTAGFVSKGEAIVTAQFWGSFNSS